VLKAFILSKSKQSEEMSALWVSANTHRAVIPSP
jgi:hypothetical protein